MNSLRVLGVLSDSAVSVFPIAIHRRGAEVTEVSAEKAKLSQLKLERLVGGRKYLTLISADNRNRYHLIDVHELFHDFENVWPDPRYS